MKLTLTQPVLRRLLSVYLTHREQLTDHEQQLGARICSCTLCEHLWVRRIKKVPTRCPKCARTSWNRPLLELMIAQDGAANAARKDQLLNRLLTSPTAHVDAPTSPGKGDGQA